MAPPLSVPVDTNPIVKEPPLFADGTAFPTNTVDNTLDLSPALGGGSVNGLSYDNNAEELFIHTGGGNITVTDGLSANVDRSFSLATSRVDGIFIKGDHLYSCDFGEIVYQDRKSDGVNVSSVDVSGSVPNNINAITFLGNDLVVIDSQNIRYRFDGFSNSLKNSVNLSGDMTLQSQGIAFFGDDESSNMLVADRDDLYRFGDVNGTLLDTSDLTGLGSINSLFVLSPTDEPSAVVGDANEAFTLQNQDNGETFTGNSGKTLKEGKIYSFEIQGPNSTTTPTLNDDGQGAFTITLPGGAEIPIGALTGNFDFLFNGTNYVVVSLTEALAEAIYGYEAGVLDNLTAASDPTVNDDSDDGYSPRSRWFNTSSSEAFMCLDATVGAAVWVKTSLTLDELGSAAVEDVGTAIGDVVQLENVGGNAGMPAVDGSQLTNVGAPQDQIAQAWVNFDGTGTVSIRDHYNVSSITDNGTGDYTVNFSSNLADTNYSVVTGGIPDRSGGRIGHIVGPGGTSDLAVGSVGIISTIGSSAGNAAQIQDLDLIMVSIFGGN